jgi:hypothetical protein
MKVERSGYRFVPLLWLLALANCLSPASSARPERDAHALSEDDYSVIGSALREIQSRTENPLVLQAETDASELVRSHWCENIGADSGTRESRATAPLPESVAALCTANQDQAILAPRFGNGVILIPASRIQAALAGGWEEFRSSFAGAGELVTVSRPVVLSGGESALVYLSFVRSEKGGRGDVYLLNRTKEGWRLASSYVVWVS